MSSRNEQLDGGVVKVDSAGRRWYTNDFKNEIVTQCLRPGASVAGIAVRSGLNPNLVRRWIKGVHKQTRKLVPLLPVVLPMTAGAPEVTDAIFGGIEVRVGEAVIRIGAGVPSAQLEALIRALR